MTDNKQMSLWLDTSWSCFFHLHGTKERKSAACTSFTKFALSPQTALLFSSGVPVVSAFYWYLHRNDHECFQTNIRWYEDKLEHLFWSQSKADCLLSNALSLFVWSWIHTFFLSSVFFNPVLGFISRKSICLLLNNRKACFPEVMKPRLHYAADPWHGDRI